MDVRSLGVCGEQSRMTSLDTWVCACLCTRDAQAF